MKVKEVRLACAHNLTSVSHAEAFVKFVFINFLPNCHENNNEADGSAATGPWF